MVADRQAVDQTAARLRERLRLLIRAAARHLDAEGKPNGLPIEARKELLQEMAAARRALEGQAP